MVRLSIGLVLAGCMALVTVAARAQDSSTQGLSFAGCVLSGPCKPSDRNEVAVTEERSGPYRGLKVRLRVPAARIYTALVDADEQAYLIDFTGSPDSQQPLPSVDSSEECAAEVAAFGNTRRYSSSVSYGGIRYFIALADDMTPEHQLESLRTIESWTRDNSVKPPFTTDPPLVADDVGRSLFQMDASGRSLLQDLQASARFLGPHFRGAVIACGMATGPVWQTRFLDLPLAAKAIDPNAE